VGIDPGVVDFNEFEGPREFAQRVGGSGDEDAVAGDGAIAFRAKRGWFGGIGLRTEQDPEKPNPTFIPVANEAAEWLAKQTGGIAQSMVLEATANIPSTAHILGGAVIGKDAGTGVVDRYNRVFGYRNLLVCDGAAMPANPGVNPSLTITAITEHAMSQILPAAAPA
jgi:cholesterol oxidase